VLLLIRHRQVHSLYLTPNWWGVEITRRGKNTLGAMLVMLFPFYFSRFIHNKRLFDLGSAGIIAFSAIYTISRMTILCFFLSICFFLLFPVNRAKYIKFIGLVIFIFVVALRISGVDIVEKYHRHRDPAGAKLPNFRKKIKSGEISFVNLNNIRHSHRGRLLLRGIDGLKNSPIWGHGIKSFREKKKYSLSHNDYIQIMYELGLLGLFLFFSIGYFSFRDLLKLQRRIHLQYVWLVEGQMIALMASFSILMFINAYETVIPWFILAGSQILVKVAIRQPHLCRAKGDAS
jgi:O-antigen ligase